MARLISALAFAYFVALTIIAPVTFLGFWDLVFVPAKQIDVVPLLRNVLIIVSGFVVTACLVKWRRSSFQKEIDTVRPKRFEAALELYGAHDTQYFAASRKTDELIIVDTRRHVASCEPMSFLQGWDFELKGSRTVVIISFNSLDCSTLRFSIPHKQAHDLTAKLSYLTVR